MRKFYRFALAALFAALPLASCNRTSQSLTDVDWDAFTSDSGTKTKVTLWTTIGTKNKDTFDSIISEFEKVYPGIEVDHVTKGGYDALFTAAQTAIPAGTTPTMAYCYSDHVASYLEANYAVQDMTAFMNDPEHGFGTDEGTFTDPYGNSVKNSNSKDDMVSGYLNDGHSYILDGKKLPGYYSLPYTRSSEVIVYNKSFFEKHNLDESKLSTWKGIWEICKTIVDNKWIDVDSSKLGKVAPLGYDSTSNMFITLSEQLGIPYTDGTAANPLTFFNPGKDQGGKKLLNTLRDYYQDHYFITQTSLGGSYTSSAFSTQQCVMTISSSAGINYCVPAASSEDGTQPFEVGVVAYPTMGDGSFVDGVEVGADAKTDAVISQGPSMTFFSRASMQEKAAAWLFYKFSTGSYWNAVWAGETGYEPVRASSYQQEVFKKKTTPAADADLNTKAKAEANKKVHELVNGYGSNDRLFTSDVFVGSAQARIAVGSLLDGTLSATDFSDAKLDELYTQYMTQAAQALPQA